MSAPSAAPDVETTNWNAVKLLAAKHGIHLRPYEEPPAAAAAAADAQYGAAAPVEASEEQDLGAGTPFRITAKRIEGGRIIYRFKYRGDAPAAAPASAAAMPKSQSETAGLASLAERTPDAADAAVAKARKNLKGSRSIPTLRALHLLGAGMARTPDVRGTPVEEEQRGAGSQPPVADAVEGPGDSADAHAEVPRGVGPARTPLLSFSRGMSNSPMELRAPPRRDGRLQGGDVLGAILGLREGIVEAHSPCSGTSHSRTSSDSGAASMPSARPAATPFGHHLGVNVVPATPDKFVKSPIPRMLELGEPIFDDMPGFSPSGRSPQPDGGSSPRRRRQQEGNSLGPRSREHVLREAQSFESTDSTATARASDEHVRSDASALPLGAKSRGPELPEHDEHLFARSSDPETLIFDVLQHYALGNDADSSASSSNRSSLTPSVASGSSGPSTPGTSERSAQDATTSATCGDDPRFALWATRNPENSEGGLVLCARSGRTAPVNVHAPGPSSTPQSDAKRRSTRVADAPGRSTARPRSASRTSKAPPPLPSATFPPSDRAFLIAATPTLLVAELTSEIDNRLLADFFYTYRTFISPSTLLHLLTLRFRWAMAEHVEPREEARRRIVRVRTYVVLKHWLLHFFEVDFLPDRQLRLQLTDWLNALGADPRMAARPADASIVRSLKNTVRSLKAQYQSMGMSALLMHDAGRRPSSHSVQHHRTASSSAGSAHDGSSSPATSSQSSAGTQEHVDLDFSDASSDDVHQSPASGRPSGAGPRGNAQLKMAAATALGSPISPTVASSSANRHTLAPMMPYAQASAPQQPPTLPSSQGAISRVFVNTVGRISRFKRVLGARGAHSNGFSTARDTVGFEGLEFEANDSGDLLFIRGGLENFINFFGLRSDEDDDSGELLSTEDGSRPGHTSSDSAGMHESGSLSASAPTRSTPASSLDLSPLRDSEADKHAAAHEAGLGIEGLDIDGEAVSGAQSHAPLDAANLHSLEQQHKELELSGKGDLLHHTTSAQTLRSQSTAGPPERAPLSAAERQPTIMSRTFDDGRLSLASTSSAMSARPNIVQIDDITDLSSDEDDGAVRRALRRLPGARDLRMAKHVHDLEPEPARSSFDTLASGYGRPIDARSVASFSSLGHGSYAPSIIAMQQQRAADAALHPQVIGTVTTDLFDPDEALAGYELVKGFKLDDFDSDEEEAGDVEATLRRLEGVIDEDKQRQKAMRVEKLWLESCARKAREDGENAPQPAEHPADANGAGPSNAEADSTASVQALAPESLNVSKPVSARTDLDALLDAVAASGARDTLAAQRSQLPVAKSSALASLGSPTRIVAPSGRRASATTRAQQTPALGAPRGVFQLPPVHHSFLLSCTSETVARQLCLIEAELFKAVSWEELVSSDWKTNVGEVLDWENFYQARVRRKAEARQRGQRVSDGAVEAIVARFNLACNWVASEIVLTQNVDERAAVVAKFIRVAFKCYQQSNFASLAQIVFGLQSPWVERLRRTWAKVGMWEMRVLRDLKSFTSPLRNFRLMRNAMHDMIPEAGIDDPITFAGARAAPASSYSASGNTAKGTVSEGCVPFFGLFISDLAVNDLLHSFVDPSCPSAPVSAHKALSRDNSFAFAPSEPHAFDQLPALPAGVPVRPLVNVFKARTTALIVKTVLAFQQRACLYTYSADANVYVKTLKIRCLDGNQMTQISHIAEP